VQNNIEPVESASPGLADENASSQNLGAPLLLLIAAFGVVLRLLL
jgi:hypothetical protein